MSRFQRFDRFLNDQSLSEALRDLAEYFLREQRFHELFEVRKVQLRLDLQLPIRDWQSLDELPDDVGQQLEIGLLQACREIGTRLIKSGDVGQGWHYLQPVGDNALLRDLIREVPVTEENSDAIVEVALGQRIDPDLGLGIVLRRQGTCNAITAYESYLGMQPLEARRGPARLLVNHVYDELFQRVTESVRQAEPENAVRQPQPTLFELISNRPWLFEGLGHHIDTTHLASVVKAARSLIEASSVAKAIELTQYGERLHKDFHYKDEPPFEDIYRDTQLFLGALVGKDIDRTIAAFKQKAEVGVAAQELNPAQWYVYLLDQLGRGQEAMEAALNWILPNQQLLMQRIAPDLFDLAKRYGIFDVAKDALLSSGDLLGYATLAAMEFQAAGGGD